MDRDDKRERLVVGRFGRRAGNRTGSSALGPHAREPWRLRGSDSLTQEPAKELRPRLAGKLNAVARRADEAINKRHCQHPTDDQTCPSRTTTPARGAPTSLART